MAELLSWHRVGQAVVMKEGLGPHSVEVARQIGANVPTIGRVYTIRAIEIDKGHVGFLLKEVVNLEFPFKGGGLGEPSFLATLFRPVRKTSIDCFRSLLNPSPEDKARFFVELVELMERADV